MRNCLVADPFPVLYEWYQPGDLLIGGMVSQIVFVFNEHWFDEYPSHRIFEITK